MEKEFKEWLAKQPSDRVFDYNSGSNCAIAQFTGGDAGFDYVGVSGKGTTHFTPEFAQALRGGFSVDELRDRSYERNGGNPTVYWPMTFGEIKTALGMEG